VRCGCATLKKWKGAGATIKPPKGDAGRLTGAGATAQSS
jgi:hypothetical protein